jgi:hypothetical protein
VIVRATRTAAATTSSDERIAGTPRHEALSDEYHEVASNFRLLTEIRFKLLALLPIAAAAAAALGSSAADDHAATVLGLSIFGLAVTSGLVMYNVRNDQLYNELVGRAANIERSLGLPDGAFANRPTAWLSIPLPRERQWPVDHGRSVGLIYVASVSLWAFMGLSAGAQVAWGARPIPWWVVITTLAAAVTITVAGARRVVAIRDARAADMRSAAALAVVIARGGLVQAASSTRFQLLCAGLNNTAAARNPAFRAFVRTSRQDITSKPDRLDRVSSRVESVMQTMSRRAGYYADLSDEAARHYYGSDDTGVLPSLEARFVGLVTDLPPRWIDDVATGRR